MLKLNTPTRAQLQSFIPDQKALLAIESLFAALGPSTGAVLVAGDLVWSAATTRAGALAANGQAVSRTVYVDLFTAIGETYGPGDGSTTFNLPDITGRVVAGKEASATRLTTAGCGIDGDTLGAAGGSQNVTLTAAQSGVPAHSHTQASHTHTVVACQNAAGGSTLANGADFAIKSNTITSSSTTPTINNNTAADAASPTPVVQPTIVMNAFIVY